MRKQYPPTQTTPAQLGDEAAPSTPAPEARPGDSGNRRGTGPGARAPGDAPPSNTASPNSIGESFKALRWGVDSLYLSYRGALFPHILNELQQLKALAQSALPDEVAQAQLALGEHVFEVADKGKRQFPFILRDNAYHIQLSSPGGRLPMAYVQVSAELLAHVGPERAERELQSLLAQLGDLEGGAQVSRIDLYVDFVSDTDMEGWDRHAWVTRAAKIVLHAIAGEFSGWSIGLGGVMGARLYNKRLEIETSGKDWLLPLWKATGWNDEDTVWRLEFEIKREALTQHGLSALYEVLRHLNGLWSYATTEWLRLTLPNPEDQTRSRWPIHPLWGHLSSVDWEGDGGPLSRSYSPTRLPDNRKLYQLGLSVLLSYMAREGIDDLYQGQEAFITHVYEHHEAQATREGLHFDAYIAERLALKRREFNARLNNPLAAQKRQDQADQAQATAYRKASKGG